MYSVVNVTMRLMLINQNLYSTPSRSLLGGTFDPGQAEKNNLEKVVELSIDVKSVDPKNKKFKNRVFYEKL